MKKRAPKGWVKISDFEESTGISAKTITAAIKRGYIPDNFADIVGTSATSPYYLNPQQAAVCWYKSLNSAHPNQRKVRNALAGYIKTFDKTVIEPEPAAKAAAAPTMTYEDAQLQEKIAKARIAELELQEKEGALVSRERINSQLFATRCWRSQTGLQMWSWPRIIGPSFTTRSTMQSPMRCKNSRIFKQG